MTKCADNLQCVNRRSICDGKSDCKDKSDELCNDGCLKMPLKPWEEDIVKRCQEDLHRCVSVKQYCDGIAQCPDGSDETQAGCTCEDWGLGTCSNTETNLQIYCINANWDPMYALIQSDFECLDSIHNRNTNIKNMVLYNPGLYQCYSYLYYFIQGRLVANALGTVQKVQRFSEMESHDDLSQTPPPPPP